MVKQTVILMVTLISVCAANAYCGAQELGAVIKAAEQEGLVTWKSSLKDSESSAFVQAFEKKYPKIKVIHEREAGSQEAFLREVIAGAAVNDVVKIDPDIENEILEMNVLEPVKWADFGVLPQLIAPHRKNLIVGPFLYSYIFVYNTKLIKPGEAPKTYADFLKPQWKGKFIFDTDCNAFLWLVGEWGPQKVLDYLSKLSKQNPIFTRGQSKNLALMAAGDYSLTVNGMLSSAHFVAQKGGALAWNAPDTVPCDFVKLAIMKRAKHPNAAKLFLGWLGSEGFRLMNDVNPGQTVPWGGTYTESLFKGKTLSWSPSREQLPDRPAFFAKMLKAIGAK